ncbi:hypothetical protein MXD63_43190, partial [Frankia sp. Cpl3]|nr:hypothetical protein [Frankia sp. Cpl3]
IMLGVLLTQPELSGAVLPQASNLQVSPPISAAAHPDKLPLSVFALADTISAKAGSIHPMTTEYDEVLEDWQKGRQLSLKHNLFRLTRVDAGDRTAHQIVFTG